MYRMHVHIGNTDYVHTNCIQIIIQYIVEYVHKYILNVTIWVRVMIYKDRLTVYNIVHTVQYILILNTTL